jgi:hypothetical protein
VEILEEKLHASGKIQEDWATQMVASLREIETMMEEEVKFHSTLTKEVSFSILLFEFGD